MRIKTADDSKSAKVFLILFEGMLFFSIFGCRCEKKKNCGQDDVPLGKSEVKKEFLVEVQNVGF